MLPIGSAGSIPAIQNLPGAGAGAKTTSTKGSAGGFSELVGNFVQQTNDSQITSDQSVENFVTGKSDNVQQVVMAVANAEMSFQLFMEVRNKLIDSYNELMRMQF